MSAECSTLTVTLMVGTSAFAQGRGLVYGKDHAFFIDAPAGWIVDNRAGISEGLRAVFYPTGSSWQASPAVMYANVGYATEDRKLESFIQADLDKFRHDSPTIRSMNGTPIVTASGSSAEVRYLSGDRFGNSEAVAYIPEGQHVVMLVLTSKTKPAYQHALHAFITLVKSYRFITDMPEDAIGYPELIRQIANDEVMTAAGATYDRAFGRFFASHHDADMERCFATIPKPQTTRFDLLIRIGADGKVLKAITMPETNVAQCLARKMTREIVPPPPHSGYWVRVGMSIGP
jgi:hypothetical protein